ncbi:MAG: efflux RND transporter periplasmic adaptor subunit, partial [Acidobacteria bacterium]
AGAGAPPAPAAAPAAPECFLGVVVTGEAVDVAAQGEGLLEEVLVEVGDRVERGQPLARLDAENLRHQLAIERANLSTADAGRRRMALELERAEMEYQRRLGLEDIFSSAETDAARFDRDAARLQLEAAEADYARAAARIEQLTAALERSVVRAPFAGRVALRYLDAGATVASGRPILRLIGGGTQLTRFAVSPAQAGALRPGLPVRVEVETPRLSLEGVIDNVAPEIDAASQMVFVEARLPEPAAGAPPINSGAVARVSTLRDGAPLPSCLDG